MRHLIYSKSMLAAIILVGSVYSSVAQVLSPDTLLLKQHITILSDDKMEGRETGTAGEKMAYEYLSAEFRKVGLLPKGSAGYIQPFPFNAGSYMGSGNTLRIKKQSFVAGEQFYPLAYSANKTFSGEIVHVKHGVCAPGMDDYAGMENLSGKVFVMEIGYPEGIDPHSKLAEYADLRTRIDSAAAKGAVAVIFINSDKDTENPSKKYSNRITPTTLPVIFANGDVAKAMIDTKRVLVTGVTEILKKEKTGHNVLGYIDNNAKQTVVIGAHYDHLGYGEEGSLYRGERAIHNGADDNASGTAGLIELARILKASNYKSNNYLFIAFSGEEMGLLGSNHLVKHFPMPVEQVNYMLNMDMIGRLKPSDPVLIINGAGTSPEWNPAISAIVIDGVKPKTTESGVGPSDHTSFYLKDIPVLHFFSGTHDDYHKPSDDEHKINYAGQQKIMEFMLQIIAKLDTKGEIAFTKTNDSANEDAPRFKVTLGVVPDYGFDGEGMRIDGVSDGKPAQKAGLKAGDIVMQIGDHKVVDMMSYMKALGKFAKGDKTTVKVKRGDQLLDQAIEF
ncbi:MAG: Aminopeptidase YwaD precursor [Bacteroidetes bacterium ADurb.Bin397]|nr:MAG: Aminopeptidase YwaD precursor [Bacteroidetes bacterium ADurb.Bin397]